MQAPAQRPWISTGEEAVAEADIPIPPPPQQPRSQALWVSLPYRVRAAADSITGAPPFQLPFVHADPLYAEVIDPRLPEPSAEQLAALGFNEQGRTALPLAHISVVDVERALDVRSTLFRAYPWRCCRHPDSGFQFRCLSHCNCSVICFRVLSRGSASPAHCTPWCGLRCRCPSENGNRTGRH